MKKEFNENGYLHLKSFFKSDQVSLILDESKSVFERILISRDRLQLGFSEKEFYTALYKLFDEQPELIQNCGKHIQHLISLHRLALDEKITNLLKDLGMGFPVISTRPVLFFNHPKLAKKQVYYKVDAHQDWRSMQGSLNSIIIWVPLMDINISNGALKIIPGSHKDGLRANNLTDGFGFLELDELEKSKFIDVEVKKGDILVFSSFLIHESGDNVTDFPRWSCHFRYNDLDESTFIERGFPHAYIYKPIEELITKNFPNINQIEKIYGKR